ncbi:MAG: universal stress protein [Candidatus Tectomicrobia bacterium]|nr:universal stress protein [Candidatus Tectomicrobia bacterium]
MYKTIYVPVDNSDYSDRAIDLAIELAKQFGSRLVGNHVYAARMHDYRFKQMEFTLPEEYKDEAELERQRKIHDSLITMGLQLISDSYLDVMDKKAKEAGLSVERKLFDGKHYKAIIEDIKASDYDLVIMGALGMGAVKDSLIGSVTERVIRKVNTDTLIVKEVKVKENGQRKPIVVGIDGSPQSFAGLNIALHLGAALSRQVEAVGVVQPSLNGSLEIAQKMGEKAGFDLTVTSLGEGKVFERILEHVRKETPWLLVLGRTGVDSEEGEIELGNNTEHLIWKAPCNLLIVS